MKGDALDTIRAGEGAEILYLDPPYGGTLSYEEEYRIIDEILGEHHEPSAFSGRDGLDYFVSLLAQCGAYPLWVISYGNAVADLETVRAAIERFRPTRAVEIAYSHMNAVATKAEAGGEPGVHHTGWGDAAVKVYMAGPYTPARRTRRDAPGEHPPAPARPASCCSRPGTRPSAPTP